MNEDKIELQKNLLKSAWKLSLSLKSDEVWEEMGSEARRFTESLSSNLNEQIETKVVRELEDQLLKHLEKARGLQMQFQRQIRPQATEMQFVELANHIRKLLTECGLADIHQVENVREKNLTSMRKLQIALSDIEQKSEIQLKLLRNIPTNEEKTS